MIATVKESNIKTQMQKKNKELCWQITHWVFPPPSGTPVPTSAWSICSCVGVGRGASHPIPTLFQRPRTGRTLPSVPCALLFAGKQGTKSSRDFMHLEFNKKVCKVEITITTTGFEGLGKYVSIKCNKIIPNWQLNMQPT